VRGVKALKKCSLLDAKFMLFVDDSELEIIEVDIFLDERMSAYDEVDMS
jgi:hypothetical protein